MILITARQMQEIDQKTIHSFGLPGMVLMENAGRGAVDFFMDTFSPDQNQPVAVLAGSGNNGGDGFVMARYLIEKKIRTTVFLLTSKSKLTGDARTNMELFQTLCDASSLGSILEIQDAETFNTFRPKLLHHAFFIDALLGTGLNSDVRGVFKDAIELMNSASGRIFSVDIPSGLNSDTGQPLGISVKADATATFAFAKAGHILYPGNEYTGQLKIIDIGIPGFIQPSTPMTLALMAGSEIARQFVPRPFNSHKGSFGHLLVIAGSPGKTGAAALCANAAVRSGTGLVTLGVAQSIHPRTESMVIEPMTHPLPDQKDGLLDDQSLDPILSLAETRQALAIGPGIGTDKKTVKLVQKLIQQIPIPMVIDADGLNCLAEDPMILKKAKAPLILTPHPGEMAKLTGSTSRAIQADRVKFASEFATTHNVILILKGAQTLVALPDGRTHICPTGNPGMAAGGMGDVLTGLIAGLLAQGFTPGDASCAGVYIHGLCADVLAEENGPFGFTASDLVLNIPTTIHHHLL